MVDIIKQPYPATTEPLRKVQVSLLAGLVVGLFLYTFQPFGIAGVDVSNVSLFIWGYGLVTAAVLLVLLFVSPAMLPEFFSEARWTVGKNVLFFIFIVVVIGSANLYYTHLVAGMPLSMGSFVLFQLYTAAVSLVVASASTFVRYALNLKRYQRGATILTDVLELRNDSELVAVNPKQPRVVVITSENEKEELVLTEDALLYVESADNYSDVCFLDNGLLKHRLIRSSLKRVEDNLSPSFAFRCHRSFVVNLNKVMRVTGNSQGYKLHLHDADKLIPVARRLNETLLERIKNVSTPQQSD